MTSARSVIGDAPKRREDLRFITGRGGYLDDLAFEGDVHAKYAVGRWMLRSHRHFEQLAVQSRAHCCRRPLSWFEGLDSRAHANGNVKKVKTVTSLKR